MRVNVPVVPIPVPVRIISAKPRQQREAEKKEVVWSGAREEAKRMFEYHRTRKAFPKLNDTMSQMCLAGKMGFKRIALVENNGQSEVVIESHSDSRNFCF